MKSKEMKKKKRGKREQCSDIPPFKNGERIKLLHGENAGGGYKKTPEKTMAEEETDIPEKALTEEETDIPENQPGNKGNHSHIRCAE